MTRETKLSKNSPGCIGDLDSTDSMNKAAVSTGMVGVVRSKIIV